MPKLHDKNCKCCLCRGMKKGQKRPEARFLIKPRKIKPCVCGSVICKKEWDQLKKEQRSLRLQKKLKVKKCICGSPICDEESQKMPEKRLETAQRQIYEKERLKRDIKQKKNNRKQTKRRLKALKKGYKKQMKMMRKEDKRKMKSIKKTKNVTDIGMIAESLIDLGTFGSKAFCDIAAYMLRSIKHPKDSMSDVYAMINDPGSAGNAIKQSAERAGLFGTLARIKQRLLKVPAGKKAVTKLEAYPITNYLVHIADKDPKKRMKKFKKGKKKRQNFECSTYMASMRKKPCLRIYYMCPWFYPHCKSLLTVWKQVTDILLFLLAVLVWSPCILCMELCRGFLCCFMCQG